MEITQNRYSDKRFFRLEKDCIYFNIKSPTEDVSGKFKYEELGLSTMTVRKKEASWIFSIFALIGMFALRPLIESTKDKNAIDIAFITVAVIVIFGALFYLILETRKELIGILDGSKTISMHRSTPSKEEVDQFINELQNKIRDRMIQINVKVSDTTIDAEVKLYHLQILLDNGVIDQLKFSQLEKEIKNVKTKKSIGFNTEER